MQRRMLRFFVLASAAAWFAWWPVLAEEPAAPVAAPDRERATLSSRLDSMQDTLSERSITSGNDGFETLIATAHGQCPSVPVAYLTPAGLLDVEEGFIDRLTDGQREVLLVAAPGAAEDGFPECSDSLGGASCPAEAFLRVFSQVGLMQAFVEEVCKPGIVH